jgi:FKBP-type peptidyl-prolyl cis-trans isomerase FklB
MQKAKTMAALLGGLLFFSYANAQQNMDSLSYSLGILLAQNLKSQGFGELDQATFQEAFGAVMAGEPTKMDANQANAYIQQHMQSLQAKQYEAKIAEGKKFLEENARREGVQQTASGLQYEVLVAGEGPKPGPDDKVTVHYHGTLTDGSVFDSSVERGQPATFGVGQVIAGWTEALQLMPQGAKWKLFIPSELAYGPRGAGGKIGPYATLIFEVELLKIN